MKKTNKKLYIIFIILLIIFSISIVNKSMQNDTFFTIPIAKDMLERGGLDGIDHLTQHEGLVFTHSGWIFDLTIYNTYQIFGFCGIYILTIFVTILISILLFNLMLKNNNIILSFISSMFMLLAASGVFAARGQLFSFLIFLIELHAIYGLKNSGKKRYVITLIILPIILANTHDTVWPFYFIMFLPYIAEFIISKIKFLKNEDNYKIIIEENKYFKMMCFIIIISLFTGLLTPVFGTAYINLFTVMDGVSKTFIQELQVTDILSQFPILLIVFIIIGIIGFTKTKIKLSDLLYVFGFVILSLMVGRNAYFLYLLGSIFVVNIITAFINTYYTEEDIEKLTNKISQNNILLLLVTIIVILYSLVGITENMNKEYVDKALYPVEAVEWMKKNVDIENMNIYNSFNYGSYLELNGIKVFMDSRSGIYCEEFSDGTTIMIDYLSVEDGLIHYKDIFEQYNITHVLITNESVINQYICYDSEYECIYQDDCFVLYEKNVDI